MDWWEMIWLIKDDLIPLWFQPIEATGIDWIDEAYSEFEKHYIPESDIHKRLDCSMFRKSIEKHMPKELFDTITRFEVIDNNWRAYVSKWVSIKQSIQDDWRTLKIFVDWRWVNPQEELIPLDAAKIMNEICRHSVEWKLWEKCDYEIMYKILSKYSATQQKKFTRDELEEWYKFHEDFVHWMHFDEAIEHFLATNLLLE